MFSSIPTLVRANTDEYEKNSTIESRFDAAINLIG
jgi:hypothetical protein